MPGWEELRAHLRKTFTLTRDEPAAVALRFTVKVGEQEFHQGVGLAPTTVIDRPWVAMIAEIAVEEGFPLRTATVYLDRLPFGGLVLRNGTYLLRHGIAMDTAIADLEWTIRLLAHEALRMRINLKNQAQGSAFTNYSE